MKNSIYSHHVNKAWKSSYGKERKSRNIIDEDWDIIDYISEIDNMENQFFEN